ncbi:hypothetical protein [uncultured Aquimarina sp.]|uniref:DUF6973 domain-containing protein n=1 Tax=uncultured Aquimarina sp. TaxID=575652 RepID=UPI00262A8714|nr:hypothetical protein [uncultured Aquimarina sp.]
MKIRNIIKRFSIRQLFRLSRLLLQNPWYIIPTLRATKRTMIICDSLFGKAHHKNGKANAFRHALWNILICQKTYIHSKNEKKSIVWTQKITDLHEKLAPNKAIAEAMDLHNNRLGRLYFKSLSSASEEETVAFLKEKTKNANLIKDIEGVKQFQDDLVHLSDEND